MTVEACENKTEVQRSTLRCGMFFSDKWCQSKTLDRKVFHDLEGEANTQSDSEMKQYSLYTFYLIQVSIFFS